MVDTAHRNTDGTGLEGVAGGVGVTALLGGWLLGLGAAAAVLLAAALAPTDPVLASEVQVGEPSEDEDGEDEPAPPPGPTQLRVLVPRDPVLAAHAGRGQHAHGRSVVPLDGDAY